MEYKAKHVIKVTGFTKYKYDQWVYKGIVKAEWPARKSGGKSTFSLQNLVQFVLVDWLSDRGVALKVASKIAYEAVEKGYSLYTGDPDSIKDLFVSINMEDPAEREYHTTLPDQFKWVGTLTIDMSHFFGIVLQAVKEFEPRLVRHKDGSATIGKGVKG